MNGKIMGIGFLLVKEIVLNTKITALKWKVSMLYPVNYQEREMKDIIWEKKMLK